MTELAIRVQAITDSVFHANPRRKIVRAAEVRKLYALRHGKDLPRPVIEEAMREVCNAGFYNWVPARRKR